MAGEAFVHGSHVAIATSDETNAQVNNARVNVAMQDATAQQLNGVYVPMAITTAGIACSVLGTHVLLLASLSERGIPPFQLRKFTIGNA